MNIAVQDPTIYEGVNLYSQGAFDKAADLFDQLSLKGDAEAMMWLGACYANGEGRPNSPTLAFEHYLKSAEAGFPQAMTNVGAMLVNGQGCDVDVEKGLIWLEKAAEKDDVGAQFNLATILSAGKEADIDMDRAAYWYKRAAEQGHYPSQARLGYCYQHGAGVEKSRVNAYLWYALAAQHGVGTALSSLERILGDMSAEEKREGIALIQSWRSKTASISNQAILDPTIQ